MKHLPLNVVLIAASLLLLCGCKKTETPVNPKGQPTTTTDTLRMYLTEAGEPYEYTAYNNDPYYGPGGDIDELLAMTWTVYGNLVPGRSFFKFNLSAIPSGTTVTSARLQLFSDTLPGNGNMIDANYGANNDFYIQRADTAWDPTTISWSNQPAPDTAGEAHVPETNQAFLDLNVDVTTMVNNMLAHGNYGFIMRLDTEIVYNSRLFCSSTYADSARHPYLVVTY